MLHQQIKEAVKRAMIEKNPVKLNVVRGLVAACTNELVAKRRKPDETLSDDEALAVIRRAAKQHQDSIEQFRLGGRGDLVEQETAELEVIKNYLPPEIDEEEIIKLAKKKMADLGLAAKKDAGKLVGTVMKELKGQVDGAIVKTTIETILR